MQFRSVTIFFVLAFMDISAFARANINEIEFNERHRIFTSHVENNEGELNDVSYPIDDLQQLRLNEIQNRHQDEIDQLNAEDLNRVNLAWFKEFDTNRAQYMPKHIAQKILRFVKWHPNVGIIGNFRYDWFGKIGFCFGRAFATHIASLYAGLFKRSVRKVFVVGDMGGWTFHVATMVKAYEGGWWVIDPIMDEVMTLEEWTAYFRNGFKKGKVRFYFTEGQRLTTRITDYKREQLGLDKKRFKDAYRGYFTDFLRSIRRPHNRRKIPHLDPNEYSSPMHKPVDFNQIQTHFRPIFTNNSGQLISGKHACEINFQMSFQ